MHLNKFVYFLLIAGIALIFTGCDIEKTEDGEAPDVDVSAEAGELPEYEVVQTQEGEMPDMDVDFDAGSMPEYEVDWMDIDIGMTEETVTVPKLEVVMEEEVVSVPVIDITMPNGDEGSAERRTLELQAHVPHAGHDLSITNVYALDNRILVVGELVETEPSAESQVVRVSDRVILSAPDLNVRYYLTGEEPLPRNSSDFVYITSKDVISENLNEAVEIYSG